MPDAPAAETGPDKEEDRPTAEATPQVAGPAGDSPSTAAAGAVPPAEPAQAVFPASTAEAATPAADALVPAGQEPEQPDAGFGQRGQLRRRLRFLRRARELGLRDLGGLVFDMHRFGRPREKLVAGKVATLTRIDGELRALEVVLDDAQPLTVLREPGITACPHCFAIRGTEANFCPNCGMPSGRRTRVAVAAPMVPGGGPPKGSAPPPQPIPAPEAPTAAFEVPTPADAQPSGDAPPPADAPPPTEPPAAEPPTADPSAS
jgi:hypothetical protein